MNLVVLSSFFRKRRMLFTANAMSAVVQLFGLNYCNKCVIKFVPAYSRHLNGTVGFIN
nr:AlNc14C108G6305 [Albugo laibachii Nc14]|eukprot:CCA20979.1 AlNc14C108G6305 [Albugo laibachii Nc14]